MKTNSRLRGLRFFLATCASVACACICVLLIAGQYHTARFQLDTYEREYQGWEAFEKTNPAYFEANEEAVKSCQRSLKDAQNNFWVKLPKTHVAGLFAAAGLGSAASGYLVTWVVLWLMSAGAYGFARWLALCLQAKPRRRPGAHPASWRAGPASAPPGVPGGTLPRTATPASARHSTVRWENRVSVGQTSGPARCKVQN
jgi:hypothetical protein